MVSIERLCEWNWAPTRAYVRAMAADLLQAQKEDIQINLGRNWPDCFIGCFERLQIT